MKKNLFATRRPFVLAMLLCCCISSANTWRFRHIDTHGVEVRDVALHTDGSAWLATNKGMYRISSIDDDWTKARMSNPTLRREIKKVTVLSNDILLLQNIENSQIVYLPSCDSITYLPQVLARQGIYVDGQLNVESDNGHIWTWYARSLVRLTTPELKVDTMLTMDEPITNVVTARNHLLVMHNKVMHRYNSHDLQLEATTPIPFGDEAVYQHYSCNGRMLWAAGRDLWQYDIAGERRRWMKIRENCNASSAVCTKDGALLVGTEAEGVLLFGSDGKYAGTIENDQREFNSLFSNRISAMHVDSDGRVWIAYAKGTISVNVEGMPKMQLLHIDHLQASRQHEDIGALGIADGTLLLGTDGQGLHPSIINGLEEASITCIFSASAQRTCVGTYQQGMYVRQHGRQRHYLDHLSPYSITESPDGHLVVGTLGNGIYIEDADTMRHIDTPAIWILQVCAQKQNVWIASSNGLFCLDLATMKARTIDSNREGTEHFSKPSFSSVFCDSRGLVWVICSDGEGVLNCYDPEYGCIYRFDDRGLPSVQSIVEDEQGNVWLTTEGSITEVKVEYDKQHQNYTFLFHPYPVPYKFNERASLLLPDGNLAFGTTEGWIAVLLSGELDQDILQSHSSPVWLWPTLAAIAALAICGTCLFCLRRKRTRGKPSAPRVNLDLQQPEITPSMELFVRRATEIVEQHIDDAGFGVNEMSQLMGMHRSSMTKHLNEAIGMTPLNFIRHIRLERAHHLLSKGKMTVAETAYAVGYNSPKLFARQFKQEFGKSPSQVRLDDEAMSDT